MSLRKNLIALSLYNAASFLKEQEEAAMAAAAAPSQDEGAPIDEQGNTITLDKLIDRINIIRSGLSFEDPEVYGKLTTMFKAITKEDKVKLYKQLTDISAIVQNIPSEKQTGEQTAEMPETEQPPPAVPGAVAPPAAAPPAAAPPAV